VGLKNMPRKKKKDKNGKGYTACNIPVSLANEVLNFIENYPQFGYRSFSEFVIEAVRLRLQELIKDLKS